MQKLGIVISFLFPPSFILSMYYFTFHSVAFFYCIFMLGYLLISLFFKQSLKSISTPLIYFIFVFIAYFLTSMEFIKMIPAFISSIFFLMFFISFVQNKGLILHLTKKMYKKDLSTDKESFLKASDAYWALVLLFNTLIQSGLVFYDNNELWAFYSSLGWYIYMGLALGLQLIYEKLFFISKMDRV